MPERRRRVVWAEAAVRDLEEIAAFIATGSPANAGRLLRRLWVKAESLRRNPHRGRLVPELLRFGMRAWRELVVGPYRLVYRVDANVLVVLGVFDGRRDLEDVLLDRLVRSP